MTQTIEKSLSPTNVFIVAENRLLRESLARLLRKRSDLSVIGEASYSEATSEVVAAAQAHLVLLDCLMSAHGPDLICNLRESTPQVRLVLFGMDDDADIFLQAVRLGVNGYLFAPRNFAKCSFKLSRARRISKLPSPNSVPMRASS
jgi:DNA-binding NarL/FixJ family response regulator